jgi:hypothetical protein
MSRMRIKLKLKRRDLMVSSDGKPKTIADFADEERISYEEAHRTVIALHQGGLIRKVGNRLYYTKLGQQVDRFEPERPEVTALYPPLPGEHRPKKRARKSKAAGGGR